MKDKKILGSVFLITIIILIVISISMIASVSFTKGMREYNNYYYFLQRQVVWIILGAGVFYAVFNNRTTDGIKGKGRHCIYWV